MADNGGQPNNPVTILVKKADGSFERKTLDEVNALKKGQTATLTPAPASVATPTVQVASTQPSMPKVSRASLEAALKADSKKSEPVAAPISNISTDGQTDEVVKKIPFTVPATSANRLRTLVQLRLKDIRTPDQVHEAMLRPEEDGGVGLTDDQAEQVMKLLPGWLPAVAAEAKVPAKQVEVAKTPAAPVPKPAPAPVAVAQTKPVASVQPVAVPEPVTPKSVTPPPAPKVVNPVEKQKVINTFIKNAPVEPYFKIPSESSKPMMRDITSNPMHIGPIDEIRVLTLTDFRRLSANPEEAAMRLKQKFVNLKDESVLLYMDGLEAWKHSPLYTEYVMAAIGCMATKQPLASLKDAKIINLPEIKAIIGMEQQLVYV